MVNRFLSISAITFTLVTICLTASITVPAANTGFTTLDVNGETVKIYRDDFGIPHIFAETNRGLFEAYGYTVAQDRLWQLELNRRAARGRLAEIFGPSGQPSESKIYRNIACSSSTHPLPQVVLTFSKYNF